MKRRMSALIGCLAGVMLALPAAAADKPGEGTKFYTGYRAAFAKAKSIDDILPFMSKERVKQISETPKDDRAKMFELIKMMDMKDVKVTKETKTDKGYSLDVTGKGGLADGPMKGTITLVREDGKLKVGEESWKN